MNTYSYCNIIEHELATWKERLSDATSRFDTLPSIEKYKVTPYIEGLHIILTEMNERLEEMRKSCPTSGWPPDESEYKRVGDLSATFKEREGVVCDYDFGG